MIYYTKFKVPQLGRSFIIAGNSKGICYVALHGNEKKFLKELKDYLGDEATKSAIKLSGAVKQLLEYFSGKRKVFNLRVFLNGRTFRTKALVQLSKIKYGKTISYSELARRAGNKKAIRAAASACANNPIPIIIPCQRVIAKDGSLGGFGGGLNMKRKMLTMEKAI
ncbi:MAG: methylated-DNA--[protein]-cysteine S-methyltransferase [Ignavibacteria bacterium]